MADLRLAKLPDRTPVKITISVLPDLKRALDEYAAAYAECYGQRESVVDLIPFMLSGFLESDPRLSLTPRTGGVTGDDGRLCLRVLARGRNLEALRNAGWRLMVSARGVSSHRRIPLRARQWRMDIVPAPRAVPRGGLRARHRAARARRRLDRHA